MKRKIIALLLIFVCAAFCFAGCNYGKYIENKGASGGLSQSPNKPDNPNNPNQPDKPDQPQPPVDDDKKDSYTATVYYNNAVFNPGDLEIYVVWVNDSEVKRVPLGEDGKADAGELDGRYGVYLEGLPTKYSYNPSGYIATSDARSVSILLTDIRNPERGDGRGLLMSQGCYEIIYDGTYRVVLDSADQVFYYEYTTTNAGVYSVESWVNAYDNEINPYVVQYSGSSQFKFNPQRRDGGGFSLAGGYTKNFRFEYRVDKSEVGCSFTFAVGAESKSSLYPVTVDFHIRYEGDYSADYSRIKEKRAKQATTKAEEKKQGESFVYADMGTKVFDMSNFKYNEKTGFYHRYDAEAYADDPFDYGAGYGPILCCMLKKKVPSYSTTTIYNANAVGPYSANYLTIYNCWDEEEKKYVTYDYVNFVRVDYAAVCNKDGACYVTEELKELLQMYAINHSLYTDGVSAVQGSPEYKKYSANQDALLMVACGVYI
ncbi:MAG: hypothetical protein K2M36_00800 [Clostridia bacterium]|nr:hypothetical protein [Clostridia bacterium]